MFSIPGLHYQVFLNFLYVNGQLNPYSQHFGSRL